MFKIKRGISEVIVAVLMILLVIAAVAIFWIAIRNLLNSSTEEVSTGINLVNLRIVNNIVSEADNKAIVTIKRNSGGGDLSIVKLIFDSYNGDEFSVVKDISIKEFEQERIEIALPSNTPYITKITVIPGTNTNGKESFGVLTHEVARKSTTSFILNTDISGAGWSAYWIKPPITPNILDIFGSTGAYEMASNDYNFPSNNESGLIYPGTLTLGKNYTLSVWLRSTGARINGRLGFNDINSIYFSLTDNNWKFINYTATITSPQARTFQVVETTGNNPAWQIAYPEVHEEI